MLFVTLADMMRYQMDILDPIVVVGHGELKGDLVIGNRCRPIRLLSLTLKSIVIGAMYSGMASCLMVAVCKSGLICWTMPRTG